jgi:5-methylcytosine-specific restriction endonuclease McrA
VWNQRGNDNAAGGWEAHHKVAVATVGSDSLSNCEILCIKCHKNTRTYGR